MRARIPRTNGPSPASSPSTNNSSPSERGFILILVLVLVALITILMVVVSIMARIERHASYNAARIEQARDNALFALNVAIGQLQREAGPDQRVTARADILSGTTGAAFNQPYWTGVWKTYDSNTADTNGQFQYLDGLSGDNGVTGYNIRQWSTAPTSGTAPNPGNPNMVWLVSGGTNNATINPATFSGTNSVVLAKNLSYTSSAGVVTGTSVNVPTVPMMASGTSTAILGHYAYWVSDEGVKAKVNIPDPLFGTSPTSNFGANQLNFMMPQGTDVQNGLFGADQVIDIRSVTFLSDIQKVSSLDSLGLVGLTSGTTAFPNVSGTGATYFSPDVTTYSRGVLADVCNGGLKTDLSQVFEDTNQFSLFMNTFKLYQPNQPTWATGDAKVWSIMSPSMDYYNDQNPTEFGTRWQSLLNYYSLYKSHVMTTVQPASTANSPWGNFNSYASGNLGTTTPEVDQQEFNYSSIPNASSTGTAIQEMGEGYMPRVAAFGVFWSMSSVIEPPAMTGSANYSLIVYAEPVVVLYNPYNVTLTAANSKPYTTQIGGGFMGRGFNISVGSQTVASGKPIGWGGYAVNSGSNGGTVALTTGSSANLVLNPGEMRAYGLSTQVSSSNGNLMVFTKLGDNVGQNQWAYVAPTSGTSPPSTPSQWVGTCNQNDHVVITCPKASFLVNNGGYTLATAPALWPNSNGSNNIGRIFSGNNTQTAQQTVDLGTIGAMVGAAPNTAGGTPFGFFSLRLKGLNQTQTQSQAWSPQPVFAGCDGFLGPKPYYYDTSMDDIDFILVNSATSSSEIALTPTGTPVDSFWGPDDVGKNSADPSFIVLHDIPRQPMISLGQFMHMSMRNSMNISQNYQVEENNSDMPVGGSLADPYFALTQTYTTPSYANGSNVLTCIDDNFMMNQGLFDSFYFSTVPPPSGDTDPAYTTIMQKVMPALLSGTTAFNNANIANGTVTFPNSRMRVYRKNGAAPVTTTSVTISPNNLSFFRTNAANVMLDGAFNINSTSVQAWVALLSSLSGTPVNYLNFSSSQYLSATVQNPVFRTLSPVVSGSVGAVNSSANPFPWAGVNSLTNAQVLSLATQIVNQVKTRGPFLSMADFLNRRLSATTSGSEGALQQAIDNTTINSNLVALGQPTGYNTSWSRANNGTPLAGELPPYTTVGVPGWLMQQDIVQCFSPVMTARSDSFVIRCYGEADNQVTSSTEGKAWCEAVVQRVPDYLDQLDASLSAATPYATAGLGDATPLYDRINGAGSAAPKSLVDSLNLTFGRRFKVISFRWLNETDL